MFLHFGCFHFFSQTNMVVYLLLFCSCIMVSESRLQIYQGRITYTPSPNINIFRVDRVATVEIGAMVPPSYYFDCNTTSNDGTGIQWTKLNGQHRFTVEAPGVGNGRRLDAVDIEYSDLDVYFCTDTISGERLALNITSQNPAILADNNMLGAVQGSTIGFRIFASSWPLYSSNHILWLRLDNTEIQDSEANFQEGRRVMVLNNVQPSDAGTYECKIVIPLAFGATLRGSTEFDLDVYVASSIEQHPQNLSNVVEWTDVTITCAATGNPLPTIRWERDGENELPQLATVNTRIENDTVVVSDLTFTGIRYDSAGRYRCVAGNEHTPVNSSYYADITVTSAVRLEASINNNPLSLEAPLISIREGQRLSIECFGSGTLSWSASNGLVISSDLSSRLRQNFDPTRSIQTLTIENFNMNFTATYTCTSSLGVESSVFVTSSNPAVFISTKTQYVLPTNSTTLTATIFAFPQDQAVIDWYHEGQLINTDTDDRYSVSSSGNSYMLHVRSVDSSLLGQYVTVVTVQGQNSSDFVNLSFPDPPTASVTPSSLTVSEGDQVRFQCQKGGSGTLTVTWTMEDGSGLPVGVFQDGTDLVISSVLSTHGGTYVCSVSSFAGTQSDSAVLTVFYRPTVVIRFGDFTSGSNQQLALTLSHGHQGPTFTCTADGHPTPTVQWLPDDGMSLPNGVTTGEGGELRWIRPLEFSDSGVYECRATNSNGTSVANLDILVERNPDINTIYPTIPVTPSGSDATSFLVPSGYVGVALTCNALGWPAPLVEWYMNNGDPLPTGVTSTTSSASNSAIVSASLRWERGFQSNDVGRFQCVVRKSNSDNMEVVANKIVSIRLSGGTDSTPPTVTPCNVDSTNTIYFQIRVLDTDCTSWDSSLRQHISNEF